MEFGKLDNLDHINFGLVDDNPNNQWVLSGVPASNPSLFMGCPIWSSKDWLGHIYPSNAKENQYLYHYSRQFNCIELNTTHYRIPDKTMVERWAAQVPEGFKFCPKLFQGISHQGDLTKAQHFTNAFCENISYFQTKLGCCFLQLPSHFEAKKLNNLTAFIDTFPKQIPLAVEFRHASWFDNQALIEPARAVLAAYNLATVITDVAGRQDVRHSSLTSSTAMIRFVGNGLHPSDYIRIDQWINRIIFWISQGLQNLYFFIHQPQNILCPDLAIYFCNQMAKISPNHRINPPVLIDSPTQTSLF